MDLLEDNIIHMLWNIDVLNARDILSFMLTCKQYNKLLTAKLSKTLKHVYSENITFDPLALLLQRREGKVKNSNLVKAINKSGTLQPKRAMSLLWAYHSLDESAFFVLSNYCGSFDALTKKAYDFQLTSFAESVHIVEQHLVK
jgi:hypothetical protein